MRGVYHATCVANNGWKTKKGNVFWKGITIVSPWSMADSPDGEKTRFREQISAYLTLFPMVFLPCQLFPWSSTQGSMPQQTGEFPEMRWPGRKAAKANWLQKLFFRQSANSQKETACRPHTRKDQQRRRPAYSWSAKPGAAWSQSGPKGHHRD